MTSEEFAHLLNCSQDQVNEIAVALCSADAADPHNSQFHVVRRNILGRGLILKISSRPRKVYFSFYTYSNRDYRAGLRNYLIENNVISAEGVDFDGVRGVVAENRANTDNGTVCDFYPQVAIRPNEVYHQLQSILTMRDSLMVKLHEAFTVDVPAGTAEGTQQAMNEVSEIDKVLVMQDDNMAFKKNRIVFGSPGTGKSHRLNEEAKKSFKDTNSERVTFYATYSYAQFVGTYKPVMKEVGGEEKIAYEFVPGPFLRMLVKAVNEPDPECNYLLIIEEINRANAAAVFGDVFQLLDRTDAGESEYPIGASEDVVRYLNGVADGKPVLSLQGKKFFGMVRKIQETVADDDLAPENWTPTGECKLRLPKNLYIWATMNSADQGVFPLDTAFKRRWSFEYIGIDDGESQAPELKIQIKNETYDWKTLRKFLNRLLVLNGVNEDKLMGPFFLKDATEFESKVLMYLWEDASRMCRRAVFGEIKTYSDLCKSWADKGIVVFNTKTFDDKILQGFEDDLVNA